MMNNESIDFSNKMVKGLLFVPILIGFLFVQCQSDSINTDEQPLTMIYLDTLEAAQFDSVPFLENETSARFIGLGKWNDRRRVVDYFKDGTVKGVYETKNDTQIGPWREWYFSGRPNGSGFYNSKGEKYGPWKLYYDSEFEGKDMLAAIEHYKDDALHGLLEKWHPNGAKQMQYHYVNGNKVGKGYNWYKSGKLMQEMTFDKGNLQLGKNYYENGQLAQVIPYDANGKMHGESIEYTEAGEIKRKVVFEHGKEISKQ